MQSYLWIAASARVPVSAFTRHVRALAIPGAPMTERPAERIGREHRLRSATEFEAVKREGVALRGRFCILLALVRSEEPSKVGFIASRKSVGGAVQRNRARRRLREIVRRRWARVAGRGHWLVLVAARSVLTAPHADLAADVERLLEQSGALKAVRSRT